VGLIARALEARGLPTLSMSVLWEDTEPIKPPRTCFLDFPLGCPVGRPHQPDMQRDVLRAALKAAPEFEKEPWHIKTLPFQWSPDGSRAWEQEVEDLYIHSGGLKMAAAHIREHKGKGESLVGREREFSAQWNC
jgi:hypothetical protein